MGSMEDIQTTTKTFADAHAVLVERVTVLNDKLEETKRLYLRGIKTAVEKVVESRSVLIAEIEENQYLFDKPRTQVFHGVKVGLKKQVGSIVIDDSEQTIKLIKKHFPEQVDTLIKTVETISKETLENLPAGDLKKIGVKVTDSTDSVVITPTASDVDKVVKALLKGSVDETEQAAKAA